VLPLGECWRDFELRSENTLSLSAATTLTGRRTRNQMILESNDFDRAFALLTKFREMKEPTWHYEIGRSRRP